MQVRFLQAVHDAKVHLGIADYLLEVTLKITDDKRVLSKCLVEMQKTATDIIDATIYLNSKRGDILPTGKEEKAKWFFEKIAKRSLDSEEIEEVKKILLFTKKHKEAKLEFVKGEKLVIFGSKECQILTEKGISDSMSILNRVITRFQQKT